MVIAFEHPTLIHPGWIDHYHNFVIHFKVTMTSTRVSQIGCRVITKYNLILYDIYNLSCSSKLSNRDISRCVTRKYSFSPKNDQSRVPKIIDPRNCDEVWFVTVSHWVWVWFEIGKNIFSKNTNDWLNQIPLELKKIFNPIVERG